MSTQLTRQEQLFGEVEEHYATIEVPNSTLFPFVRVVNSYVGEARLQCANGRLHTRMVGPANVAMVEVETKEKIAPNDDLTIGVNVDSLYNNLQNKPRTESNSVDVTLDLARPYGTVSVSEELNGKEWSFTDKIKCLDPDLIRQEPDIPDVELETEVDIPVERVYSWIRTTDKSNHIELAVEDERLRLAELDGSDYLSVVEVAEIDAEENEAIYSQGYLKDTFQALNAIGTESVTLGWNDEFPVEIRFETDELEGTYLIAPRIQA